MRRRFLNNINKSISGDNHLEYFAIEALEDGLTAKLSSNECEYRIDNGSWNTLSANSNTPSINKGQTLSFRGNLTPSTSSGIGTFTISKKCNIKGNIMSLLYGDDFIGQTNLTGKNYAFHKLFYNCTNIADASELILPATTVSRSCYYSMFYGCSKLTTAPELPATTLESRCYYSMFYGCTSLATAPELPATKLAIYCYQWMFSGCTGLTAAPALPATTLESYCYSHMFYGCSKLTTAPELPATKLASMCYYSMFYGCSKLNYINMLATDISASNCLNSWVLGVSSTGTFVKHPDMTSLPNGVNGIPSGWTVEDYVETNLITFRVEGSEYQAEEGMTWGEWVNSEYNVDGYIVNTDYTIAQNYNGSPLWIFDDTYMVINSDLIKSNYIYNLQGSGSGN